MTKKALLPGLTCYILFLLSSCTTETWYKTPTGLQYHLFSSSSKGALSATGCTVKVNMIVKVKDAITSSTEGSMPIYQAIIPGIVNGYEAMEVFSYGLKEGDSVVVVQRIDSLVKKGLLASIPAGMKGSDERITYMKLLKVFPQTGAANLIEEDKAAELKKADMAQRIKGRERVENFIKENKINAVALDSGIYIETLQKGANALIDTGNYVYLQYRLKSLHGHVINTDMDTSFHHLDTLHYAVGSGYMLRGVDRALTKLQKGSRANIYVPTMMAFGSNPPEKGAPSYVDIIMEVNIINVLPKKTVKQKG